MLHLVPGIMLSQSRRVASLTERAVTQSATLSAVPCNRMASRHPDKYRRDVMVKATNNQARHRKLIVCKAGLSTGTHSLQPRWDVE